MLTRREFMAKASASLLGFCPAVGAVVGLVGAGKVAEAVTQQKWLTMATTQKSRNLLKADPGRCKWYKWDIQNEGWVQIKNPTSEDLNWAHRFEEQPNHNGLTQKQIDNLIEYIIDFSRKYHSNPKSI